MREACIYMQVLDGKFICSPCHAAPPRPAQKSGTICLFTDFMLSERRKQVKVLFGFHHVVSVKKNKTFPQSYLGCIKMGIYLWKGPVMVIRKML